MWDTIPKLVSRLTEVHPQLKVQAREVFGSDIAELLLGERFDVAIAPMTSYPRGFQSQVIRREPIRIALRNADPLAGRKRLKLTTLADLPFELWPREMAPGFYDAVIGTCRAAGFDPAIDEQATGNTVWGNIARGRGVALINASISQRLPRGISLVEPERPATLTYEAVWHQGDLPLIRRTLETAAQLADIGHWL